MQSYRGESDSYQPVISRVLFFTVDGGIGDALLGDIVGVVVKADGKSFLAAVGKTTTVYPAKIPRVGKSAGKVSPSRLS